MLLACRPLGEYAWFVAQARKNLAGSKGDEEVDIGDAIDQTIDEMPEDFEIKKFITANRVEVRDMCLTEYSETETMEMLRQEALQEGLQEGRKEGHKEGRKEGQQESRLLDIKNLMDSTGWTAERAMDILKIPLNQRDIFYTGFQKRYNTIVLF